MSYCVRLMRKEDLTQVIDIDREAFPTQWPPPNYQHELHNMLAHYIVACDETETVAEPEPPAPSEKGFYHLSSRVRRWFNRTYRSGNGPSQPSRQLIVGFAGIWMMADEAHLTNIATRQRYQRRGIGEMLLISIIDLSVKLKASIVTLEVRVSNTAAQSLYYKHGFIQTGLRRAYYTDNREDAMLMSTESIASASFQARFQQLKEAHSRKWEIASYESTENCPAPPGGR